MKLTKNGGAGGGGGGVLTVTASAPLNSTGGANPDISILTAVPIALGGTGQVTANAARNALLPAQALHAGEFLTTNGVDVSWAAAGGGTIGGTAAAGRVSFGTGVNTIGSSVDITWDDVNKLFAVGNPALSYAGIGVNVNVLQLGAATTRLPMLVWQADDVTINLPYVGFPPTVAGLMTTDNIAGTSIGGMVFTGLTDSGQNGSIIKFNGFFSNVAATAPAYIFESPLIWNGAAYVDPAPTSINFRLASNGGTADTNFLANGTWSIGGNVRVNKEISFTGTVALDATRLGQLGISTVGANPLFILTQTATVAGDSGKEFIVLTGAGAPADAVFTGGLGGLITLSPGSGGDASATLGGGTGGLVQIFGGTGGNGTATAVAGSGGSINLTGGTPGIDGGFGPGTYGSVTLGTATGIEFHVTPTDISSLIPDNAINAFRVIQSLDSYINVSTVNGAENISFGNAVTNPTFSFLGTGVPSARTSLGIQSGTSTLVAGTVTIVATITASSRIVVTIQDAVPGAGNLTIELAVPNATRVVGAPGSFDVQANIAAGTINVLDTSTFDWIVIG